MDEADIPDEPVRHQAFSGACRIVGVDGAAQATPPDRRWLA
jgi:hypothetical protein